ncbi:MAG: (2Fe-2S)-binding protein [Candidatus Competibacteraceae bacterium]
MFLCICKSISDTQIREAVDQGARTIGDISARFGVGVECGKCLDDVRQFLDACLLAPPSPVTAIDSTIDPDGGRGHAAARRRARPSAGGLVCRGLMISR